MRMRVNSFRLESPKIVKPSKILVMSDIHNNQEIFDDLLEIVGEQKPDYICLAGDTLDEADCDIAGLVDWLKKLAKKATVIIGLGNHELCWCDRPFRRPVPGENQDFYSAIGKIKNCVLLKDEFSTYQPDDNLAFSALNMPISWYSDRRENKAEFKKAVKRAGREAASGGAANKLDKGRFNVLLSHSPNGWLFRGKLLARDEFRLMNRLDLILSGHNHGGLVPGVFRPVLRHYWFFGPSAKRGGPPAF
ncbi:metallophosphoesterase, partial [Candidatus Saccharibacteria bacterium]|nr:metallophosphoesterase [Candidatus Saccharibacteria bacterium]